MNTHTKGPWSLETVKTQSGICHKVGPFPWRPNRDNHACLYVDYPSNGPIEKELLANARLIVAAPELLQSCIDLLSVVRIQNGNLHEDINAIQAAAIAAIEKATAE